MKVVSSTICAFLVLCTVSACVKDRYSSGTGATYDQYNSGQMAKDWRSQVKNQPVYPYAYPQDNDSDYYIPKKPVPGYTTHGGTIVPVTPAVPVVPYVYPKGYSADMEDSAYPVRGRYSYPKYDPDADNEGYGGTVNKKNLDKYNYPIYLDQ